MKGKTALYFLLLIFVIFTSIVAYLIYKRWTLTGTFNPFALTTLTSEIVTVSGTLNGRRVVINDTAALLMLIKELNTFQPNTVSLMGGDYTTGHTITKMSIIFTDLPRQHPLYGSVSGATRSSMESVLAKDGTLTMTIHINVDKKSDQQINNHLHTALFTALYLVSNDIRPSDVLDRAATFATEKITQIENIPMERRIIVVQSTHDE